MADVKSSSLLPQRMQRHATTPITRVIDGYVDVKTSTPSPARSDGASASAAAAAAGVPAKPSTDTKILPAKDASSIFPFDLSQFPVKIQRRVVERYLESCLVAGRLVGVPDGSKQAAGAQLLRRLAGDGYAGETMWYYGWNGVDIALQNNTNFHTWTAPRFLDICAVQPVNNGAVPQPYERLSTEIIIDRIKMDCIVDVVPTYAQSAAPSQTGPVTFRHIILHDEMPFIYLVGLDPEPLCETVLNTQDPLLFHAPFAADIDIASSPLHVAMMQPHRNTMGLRYKVLHDEVYEVPIPTTTVMADPVMAGYSVVNAGRKRYSIDIHPRSHVYYQNMSAGGSIVGSIYHMIVSCEPSNSLFTVRHSGEMRVHFTNVEDLTKDK